MTKEQKDIGPDELTRDVVDRSVNETWIKLERAVQNTLDDIISGKAELNASTTQSVVKFWEASKVLASDLYKPHNMQSLFDRLPTFDDEYSNEFAVVEPKSKRNRKTKGEF
jgi:hypothetical protein